MTYEDRIGLVRQGYEALNRGDIDSVLELVHRDFSWSDPPEVVGGGGGAGHEEFAFYLLGLRAAWDDFRCVPETFGVVGDALLVVVRESGRGKLSGAIVEHRLVHEWRFEGARAVRLKAYIDPRDALQAA